MRAALTSLRLRAARLARLTPERFDEYEFLWDETEDPEDDSGPEVEIQARGQAE